jgi:quercetin dioxygenase-like cupin family protein
MDAVHLPALRAFSTPKFEPRLVYGSAGARVFQLCLEPGQGLPTRVDSEEVLCYVIEGRVRLARGEEVLALEAGDLVGVAAGEERGLHAETRAVVLWVQLAEKDTGRD